MDTVSSDICLGDDPIKSGTGCGSINEEEMNIIKVIPSRIHSSRERR